MKIKVIKKMPRLITIPGNLNKKQFRDLQAGKIVDVNDASAAYLVRSGFAEEVKAIASKATKGGDE